MTDETRICPFCGEEIKFVAIKCKHCGTMLSGSEPGADASDGWRGQGGPLQMGTTIREYRIEKILGQGGMGEVYKAVHVQTEQLVAMKVIAPELMREDSIRNRFLEEARVMADLNHPNVVRLLNFFEEGGRLFLIMDFVDGRDLEGVLNERVLSGAEAVDIASRILAGLSYGHTRPKPVIHRDIKPANILLGDDGRVVITDFGIAKAVGREKLTQTRGVIGTFEYMSPEQVQGSDVGPRSDVYSVGITLYKMLTGVVPFPQKTDTGIDVMKGHLESKPPPIGEFREDVPDLLQRVVEKALAKAPEQRFADAQAMADAMHSGLPDTAGAPVTRRPSPEQPPPPAPVTGESEEASDVSASIDSSEKKSGGRAVLIGAAALVVLALLGYAAYSIWGPGKGQEDGGSGVQSKVTQGPIFAPREEPSGSAREAERAAHGEQVGKTRESEKMGPSPGGGSTVAGVSRKAKCVRQCDEKECGADGCGGACGECGGGRRCSLGKCACLHQNCSGRCCEYGDVCWEGGCCSPSCSGRECGTDGCGGSCGSCSGADTCSAGRCTCTPDCGGTECGPDGCRGSCGTCSTGEKCVSGQCKEVVNLEVRRRGARATFDGWLQSWNNLDIGEFERYYSQSFSFYNTWGDKTTVESRSKRIKSSRSLWKRVDWLRVNARDVRVTVSGDGREATVKFVQEYRSDRYNSNGSVTLEMEREGGKWRITKESFVGIRRL